MDLKIAIDPEKVIPLWDSTFILTYWVDLDIICNLDKTIQLGDKNALIESEERTIWFSDIPIFSQ